VIDLYTINRYDYLLTKTVEITSVALNLPLKMKISPELSTVLWVSLLSLDL